VLLDTSVLIDLQREVASGRSGPACAWLEARSAQPLSVSVVTVGEFAEGFADVESRLLRDLLSGFEVVPIDHSVALVYARLSRQMRADNRRIGDNDIWIAATAIAYGLPLVTRDARRMGRIAGLSIVTY